MDRAVTVGTQHRSAARKHRSRGWRFVRSLTLILFVAIVTAGVTKAFIARSFYIPSGSMESTLLINDRVLVDALTPRWEGFDRGDIVVFRDGLHWLGEPTGEQPSPIARAADAVGLLAADGEHYLIKRVIGIAGDTVICCDDGALIVNGVTIAETYLQEPAMRASAAEFSIVVPDGRLWVMGDNRNKSADSRSHQDRVGGGSIALTDVVGRATLITWPVARWTRIDTPHETFAHVPDGVTFDASAPPEPSRPAP